MSTFDVVVVGGGPTGEEAAARPPDRGMSVALVEDRLVGGECGHWACILSKSLRRPPEVLAEAGRIRGARESLHGGPNVAAMLARRDEVIGVDEHTGEPERRVLIGSTFTGSEVADFLHAATVAVVGELPLERLRHALPPFPTRSEPWLSLLEQPGV